MRLTVRKFFCDHCRRRRGWRRIFSEQFPGLVDRRGRCTTRLNRALREIGQTVGAEAGARLAIKLGMPVSGDTILRRVRAAPIPPAPSAQVIGVDDWAFKKGQTYRTIICDLERSVPSICYQIANGSRSAPGYKIIRKPAPPGC